jgi:hypothetical protein
VLYFNSTPTFGILTHVLIVLSPTLLQMPLFFHFLELLIFELRYFVHTDPGDRNTVPFIGPEKTFFEQILYFLVCQ